VFSGTAANIRGSTKDKRPFTRHFTMSGFHSSWGIIENQFPVTPFQRPYPVRVGDYLRFARQPPTIGAISRESANLELYELRRRRYTIQQAIHSRTAQ